MYKIKKIEFTLFEVSIPNIGSDQSGFGVWYEPGFNSQQKRFAIQIFTEEGFIGEYIPPRSRATVVMPASIALSNFIINKSCLERENHYQTMRRATKHVGEAGIGALDIALWDLAGKISGQSISTMLGGYRKKLPAYASSKAAIDNIFAEDPEFTKTLYLTPNHSDHSCSNFSTFSP